MRRQGQRANAISVQGTGSRAESKLKLIRRAGGRNPTPRARSLHLSFIMRAICCSSPRMHPPVPRYPAPAIPFLTTQPFYVHLFFIQIFKPRSAIFFITFYGICLSCHGVNLQFILRDDMNVLHVSLHNVSS